MSWNNFKRGIINKKFSSLKGIDYWIVDAVFNYKEKLFFMDINPNNYYNDNNTYILESMLNWTGICLVDENKIDEFKKYRNSNILSLNNFMDSDLKDNNIDYFSVNSINENLNDILNLIKKFIPMVLTIEGNCDSFHNDLISLGYIFIRHSTPFNINRCSFYIHKNFNNYKIQKKIDNKNYNINIKNNIQFVSQKCQDYWVIDTVFDYKKNGYFVNLGAWDGKDRDNTYLLEKVLNWDGICIEANEKIFSELKKNRNCQCINVCVNDKNEKVYFNENNMAGGICSDDTDNNLNNSSKLIESYTLEHIFKKNNVPEVIDFMSVDIEGAETRIFRSFPFKKYKILSLIIERPTPELNNILFENGYVFVRNSTLWNYFDTFYIHKDIKNFESIPKSNFKQIPSKKQLNYNKINGKYIYG